MAVRFDADGEDYTAALTLGVQTDFTMCCWAKLAVDRDTWSTFLAVDNGSAADTTIIACSADGTTTRFYSDGAGPFFSLDSLTVGTWYFLALSRAGVTINGYCQAAGSGSMSTGSAATATADQNMGTLRIGESVFTAEWLNGGITAVKVWTAALTQAELQAEMSQHVPARSANLAAWYPLIIPETVDRSGNGKTLSGGAGTTQEAGPDIPWLSTWERRPAMSTTTAVQRAANY